MSWSLLLRQPPPVLVGSPSLPTHNNSGLYDDERRSPLFPDLHQGYPEQSIATPEPRTRLFPFEDRQLRSQSGILQGDLFVAGEDENDESQRAENPTAARVASAKIERLFQATTFGTI